MVRGTARSDPSRPIFIDETGASTTGAKGGRRRRGQRLRAAVPHGHYKTVTLVAGLSLRGVVAQKVFDRPINAALFEEWVEPCPVPTLSKGDIVVTDNFRPRRAAGRRADRSRGAELRDLRPRASTWSDREGLFEAQGLLAQDRRTQRRRPDVRARNLRIHLQARRMRKLL